jgi:hypothetical protein
VLREKKAEVKKEAEVKKKAKVKKKAPKPIAKRPKT